MTKLSLPNDDVHLIINPIPDSLITPNGGAFLQTRACYSYFYYFFLLLRIYLELRMIKRDSYNLLLNPTWKLILFYPLLRGDFRTQNRLKLGKPSQPLPPPRLIKTISQPQNLRPPPPTWDGRKSKARRREAVESSFKASCQSSE